MRQASACSACRSRRRKCKPVPGGPCSYCLQRGLPCSSSRPGQAGATRLAGETINLAQGSDSRRCNLSAKPLCLELVELYFDYVHDQLHSLFHKTTFLEDVRNGNAPPILLYGMMALSARFSNHPLLIGIDPRNRAEKFAQQCESLLNLNDVSVMTIQACVLLGAIAITDGKPASESIYYAVACRIAQLLDLPNRKGSQLDCEINIRIWWTLSMIDTWSSNGVRLPRLLQPKDVPLPMEEMTFLEMRQGSDISTPGKTSLLAEMVRLNRILQQINEFNIKSSESDMEPISILRSVEGLSNQLDAWHRELPDHFRDTHENMERCAAQGLGRVFVAIYLGYYHYGQILFYRFLHEDLQQLKGDPDTKAYAALCKLHAEKLCRIVYASESTRGCDVKYNMVGHVLVISSTIHLHSLLFDSNREASHAKDCLEKNFCILNRLCRLWPTLDFCMERLMAFHEACKNSADTSFRMDAWMVRFLVEFASPVNGKDSLRLREQNATWLSDLGIEARPAG